MALGTITKVRHISANSPTGGRALDSFFSPKRVAVSGATENAGSVGRTVPLNLAQGAFADKVYAVNPAIKRFAACAGVPPASVFVVGSQ